MDNRELLKNLDQFIGTKHYYLYGSIMMNMLTDGCQYLAEKAECFWLFGAIDNLIYNHGLKKYKMLFCTLTVDVDAQVGALQIDEDIDKPLAYQKIEYTTFPLPKIDIWSQWYPAANCYIHMLKSEY